MPYKNINLNYNSMKNSPLVTIPSAIFCGMQKKSL